MQAEQQSERERFTEADIRGAWREWPRQAVTGAERAIEFVRFLEARAALSHPSPQGWKLVPVEPTEEMLAAGEIPTIEMPLRGGGTYQMLGLGAGPSSIYRKMLAVSPPPPEQGSSNV